MDSVEELFKAFPSPEVDFQSDGKENAEAILCAIDAFTHENASQDPDYPYLMKYAQNAFTCGDAPLDYFRDQLAQLALRRTASIAIEGDSHKSRQLKYHAWIARGRKDETQPFAEPLGGAESASHSSLSQLDMISAAPTLELADEVGCASCGKAGAKARCNGCCVNLGSDTEMKTVYCNKDCQRAHREEHRATCKGRQMIQRASSLLGTVFLMVEQVTFVYPIVHVMLKDNILYTFAESWDQLAMTGRHIFHSFPEHLVATDDDARGVVLLNECEEIAYSAKALVEYILGPLCKSLDQVLVKPKNARRPICQMADGIGVNNMFGYHTVLRATLHSGEQFAVDLTAAQFGWRDTVSPWEPYVRHHTAGRFKVQAFGTVDPKTREAREKKDIFAQRHALRCLVADTITKRFDVFLKNPYKMQSIEELFRLPAAKYEVAKKAALYMTKTATDLLTHQVAKGSTSRLYYNGDFVLKVAGEQTKALEDVWMTEEEYLKYKGDKGRLMLVWRERIGRTGK